MMPTSDGVPAGAGVTSVMQTEATDVGVGARRRRCGTPEED
jgi:hypothetical protein